MYDIRPIEDPRVQADLWRLRQDTDKTPEVQFLLDLLDRQMALVEPPVLAEALYRLQGSPGKPWTAVQSLAAGVFRRRAARLLEHLHDITGYNNEGV